MLAKRFLQRLPTGSRSVHRSAVAALPEIPFKLADIGEGIAEVELLQWFVNDGDTVSQFQKVCEVQSDKATVEITSRFDGVVTKRHYEVGDMAVVGTTLIDIDVPEDVAKAAGPSTSEPKKETPQPKAPSAPTPKPEKSKPKTPEPKPQASEAPATRKTADRGISEKVKTSPAVRRLAREHNIDLENIEGTGPAGRILKEDLLAFIRDLPSTPPAPAPTSSSSSEQQASDRPKSAAYLQEDTEVSLTPVQKMMVKSMNAALAIPHFGYADEIQMDALYKLREEMKPIAKERGTKLSYMPFVVKAASLALKQYPSLNASVSEDATKMTMHAAHNISVAMDTPAGLIVPNIKNVETKSIFEVAEEMNRLQELATANKLSPADLSGGTFSISNIGAIGGTYMGPVIMVPQVAIGAIGKIQTLPRFDEHGEVQAVRLMQVSWSGDHRVIDGATMARFSNQWKQYLEKPTTMLTEMN